MDLWAIVPYYTAYLSRALLHAGADVMVGSISYYLDPECFSSRGIQLDPGLSNVVGRFRLPKTPRRVLKALEALVNMGALALRFLVAPPAILHVQYLPMLQWSVPLDSWFLALCRWRGARIVLTVHDLLPHDSAQTHRAAFQKLYHWVDGLICHSSHIQSRLVEEFGVDVDKIAVIEHGPFFYDLPETDSSAVRNSLGLAATQQIVLWQGIIFPYKGLDLLLNAWETIERETENTYLVVVGTGAPDLLQRVREQVKALGLRRVKLDLRFTSAEELVGLYRAANIVVYPYRAITTSGALATGLALGKAIVASDLPVFRELLSDGVNASLVNSEDEQELAKAVIHLAENAELRKKFSGAVQEMEFGARSWSQIARKTQEMYDKTLANSR